MAHFNVRKISDIFFSSSLHRLFVHRNCCGCRVNGISRIVRRQEKEKLTSFSCVHFVFDRCRENWNEIEYVEKWQYKRARSIEKSKYQRTNESDA